MEKIITKEQILKLVLNAVLDHCKESGIEVEIDKGEDLRLFGGESLLDSLGLVSLIVSIEELIEDQFDKSVILADEKAMSRRTSPFAKVGYLVDYIYEIININ
jgi:acyl carrier protein